jgi:hypothetical protein
MTSTLFLEPDSLLVDFDYVVNLCHSLLSRRINLLYNCTTSRLELLWNCNSIRKIHLGEFTEI